MAEEYGERSQEPAPASNQGALEIGQSCADSEKHRKTSSEPCSEHGFCLKTLEELGTSPEGTSRSAGDGQSSQLE